MKLKYVPIAALIVIASAASYSYSPCATNTFLNAANLQCVPCTSNQVANTYQTVPSVCQCSLGYTASGNGACTAISTACSYTASYSLLYSLNGDYSGAGTCLPCASTAYANRYVCPN